MAFDDRIRVKLRDRSVFTRIAGVGRPLLLLHGYPLDHRLWDATIPLLSQEYLCIAPDFRGFGNNAEEPYSFSLQDLARDCWELADCLQVRQPLLVCGLSMGGYVAMEFVDQLPERICGVILTNTRCNADDVNGQAARREIASRALREGVSSVVSSMLNKLFHASAQNRIPVAVKLVQQMMTDTPASTIAWAQLAMANRRDFTDLLSSWDMPVACVGGISDTICPPEIIDQMHRRLKHSQKYLLAESAHLTPLELPRAFAETVQQFVHGL